VVSEFALRQLAAEMSGQRPTIPSAARRTILMMNSRAGRIRPVRSAWRYASASDGSSAMAMMAIVVSLVILSSLPASPTVEQLGGESACALLVSRERSYWPDSLGAFPRPGTEKLNRGKLRSLLSGLIAAIEQSPRQNRTCIRG
jgi:hypothetical protein